MFLREVPTLKELLVVALARLGASTAHALHAAVVHDYRSCSLQAVYLELSQLLDAGVILKVSRRYDLTLAWVFKVHEFTEQLTQRYFSHSNPLEALPDERQKIKISFSDARRADIFWMQLVSKLLASSASRTMFQWAPRLWHALVHGRVCCDYGEVIRRLCNRDYMITAGETFLDRFGHASCTPDVITLSTAPSPFHKDHSKFITVLDDFVITTAYTQRFLCDVDRFFRSIKRVEQIDDRNVNRVFSQKTRVTISVERNGVKSESIRRKFLRHFGVSSPSGRPRSSKRARR